MYTLSPVAKEPTGVCDTMILFGKSEVVKRGVRKSEHV